MVKHHPHLLREDVTAGLIRLEEENSQTVTERTPTNTETKVESSSLNHRNNEWVGINGSGVDGANEAAEGEGKAVLTGATSGATSEI